MRYRVTLSVELIQLDDTAGEEILRYEVLTTEPNETIDALAAANRAAAASSVHGVRV